MTTNPYDRIREELDRAEQAGPTESLPHLRLVLDQTTVLLDEQMALAVVKDEVSIRSAAAAAGLSENAVGPRLARTNILADYARPDGRVTAADVRRAQYDRDSGAPAKKENKPKPLRFKPRRTT